MKATPAFVCCVLYKASFSLNFLQTLSEATKLHVRNEQRMENAARIVWSFPASVWSDWNCVITWKMFFPLSSCDTNSLPTSFVLVKRDTTWCASSCCCVIILLNSFAIPAQVSSSQQCNRWKFRRLLHWFLIRSKHEKSYFRVWKSMANHSENIHRNMPQEIIPSLHNLSHNHQRKHPTDGSQNTSAT